ncbi:uncharacterized protein HKW66_Vig0153470 [Vigna angularis]|uniref:Uncharacterized protein n=1 Tax=Phaseolus angularis TaxID=3914 RepID=A0A8T0JM04_PHAAN|nr:uncharacterized protein HKW66_Vig0153470 [Vigna angularis]
MIRCLTQPFTGIDCKGENSGKASLLHSIRLWKPLIVYGSDASVGVTHTSDEEWEEGEQGDVFHGEEYQSLSGGGEVDGDGCGQEEDEGGVELLWQGFELVHAG